MSFKLLNIEDVDEITKGNDNLAANFGTLFDTFIIPAIGELFAEYCGRPDFDKKARTEFLSPRKGARFVFVDSPPIAASPVVELWQSTDLPRVYGDDQKLVNGEDYFVHEAEGMIEHVSSLTGFNGGAKTIKISYEGGYVTADATDVPAKLRLAAMVQAQILFERRAEFGLTGRSLEGGSVSMLTPLMLPRSVTMLLDGYRNVRC